MKMGVSMAAGNLTKLKEDSHNVIKVRKLWVTLKEKKL
jgi:hypothetical protein